MDELPQNEEPFELSGNGVAGHSIRGEVQKVLYDSGDSGYSVIDIRDAAGEDYVLVGAMPGVAAGHGIEATGRWEQHKDYGRQFRVDSFEFTLPVTTEGILKYLSSGAIKGLGKKYAEAIVKAFGASTMDVIENAPLRLREVPGLGKKRIETIKKVWADNASRRKLQIHLQSYGVTPAYFNRIYQVYGESAAEKIHENPYILAHDVKGIGFTMADEIAAKMGVDKASSQRMLAGILYTFSQVRSNGHVCMPKELFVKYAAELLNVEPETASKALDNAVGLLQASIRKSADGQELVYEPGLLRCEMELASLLAGLASPPQHAGSRMLAFGALSGSRFSEEQLSAVRVAGNNPVSIITGGPGVGKTTVVSELVRRARLAKLKLVLCAPTGRAAKRLSETTDETAFTIHRLLKWDPASHRFVHGLGRPLDCELLIVDETSMLDILLATALFRAVRPGATVVIVGDADQLPSVGPGNVLNDIIASKLIPVTRLTKIFRQGPGSGIIVSAHRVNAGELPERPDPSLGLTDFYWIEKDDPAEAASVIERMVCGRIQQRFGFRPMTDIQVLSPMNKGTCGTQALNAMLQEKLNGTQKIRFQSGDRSFRLGDKVMQVSNNYDKGVFNGDMGRISAVDFAKKTFSVTFDTQRVDYEFYESDQLVLSYAVTIHKSQGSEFPVVILPLLTQHFIMLRRNLLYTGITRAKKLMILVGSEKAVGIAVRNATAEPRYSLLRERLVSAFAERGIEP